MTTKTKTEIEEAALLLQENNLGDVEDESGFDTEPQVDVNEEQNTRSYYIERANIMGLTFPKNISTAKLAELVQNAYATASKEKEAEAPNTANMTQGEKIAAMKADMMQLIRIRIHVLNPAKQAWAGEYFTVGNDMLPSVKRFIPYNAVDGIWHVEKIFIEMLRNRKYQYLKESTGNANSSRKNQQYGVDYNKSQLLPEFSIEILPPLTEEERLAIAANQTATGSLRDD